MISFRRVLGTVAVPLFLLMISLCAWADKKGSGGGQHAAPPSRPAPAQHAPAQHAPQQQARPQGNNQQRGPQGGNARGPAGGMNRPGGANQQGNARGPNQQGNARGPNGNANARGGNAGGANSNARGPQGNANARGGAAGGANARGQQGANARGGAAGGANARGQNTRGPAGGANARGGNNGGANTRAGNNRPGGANGNRRGPATTNREFKSKSGATVKASYRGGHVRSVETRRGDRNIRVEHGAHGQRRVVTEHNGRRVVGMGRHGGYSQRAYYNHGGRAYVQRTYYYGGQRYAYAYRGYYYGGVQYYGYAPAYYYQPAYYGWAYNPWPQPVYYNWGYYNAPWYGYYGGYYQPYPAYPYASLWLTDFMVAETLRAAYEASQSGEVTPEQTFGPSPQLVAELSSSDPLVAENSGFAFGAFYGTAPAKVAAPAPTAKLTPELKQALSEEVKQTIADEKSASETTQQAAGGKDDAPPALNPKFKYFLVSTDLSVTTDAGEDCALSSGDVIERTSDTVDDDHNVTVAVKASKKDDCAVGASVAVDSNDLQEMHNHFREQLDTGLKTLADKSGKDGLPKAPDTTTKAGEVPAPTADTNVDSELQQQQKDADDTEADVPKDDSGGQ
jgi:hypothetical protein